MILGDAEKLAAIQLLYTAYFNTDQNTTVFAPEFFYAVGEILSSTLPESLKYEYLLKDETFHDNPIEQCQCCGINLMDVGIVETTEGGSTETQIRFKYGAMCINPTDIQNPTETSIVCSNCSSELDKDTILDKLLQHATSR